MKSKLLALALCMFCGMSFLAANGAVDAKTEKPKEETAKEAALADELAKAELAKAKKAEENKTAQAEKSCCGCK